MYVDIGSVGTDGMGRRALVRRSETALVTGIALGVIAVVVLVLIACYFLWRRRQKRRNGTSSSGHNYVQTAGAESAEVEQAYQLQSSSARTQRGNAQTGTATTDVNRHTSVRSIMTLPPYRVSPSTTEQVLGREGDRDGVDIIVDLPTQEQDEALRDNEMDAMYRIRELRRQQLADTQAERERLEQARLRSDLAAVRETRASSRSRAASSNSMIDNLREQVNRSREERLRTVPSVSYGDLGVARHDGSRLRASSNESERMGLLSDAASVGRDQTPSLHHRAQSTSSFISINSEFPSPELTRSETNMGENIAGSSPELVDADLGDATTPPPPEYVEISLGDDTARNGERTSALPQEPPPDYYGSRGEGRSSESISRPGRGAVGEVDTSNNNPNSPETSNMQLPEIRVEAEVPSVPSPPGSVTGGDADTPHSTAV